MLESKTREELIKELIKLKSRVSQLESREPLRGDAEQTFPKTAELWHSSVNNNPYYTIIINRAGIVQPIDHVLPGFTWGTAGTSIFDYIMPEYHHRLKKCIDNVFETGKNCSCQVREIITEKKTPLWLEMYCSPTVQKKNDFIIIVTLNITEQKRMEQELRESEERFEKLSEMTLEGLIQHDWGKIIDVNSSLERLFGYRADEIIGEDAAKLLIAEDSKDIIGQKIISGTEGIFETLCLKKDGTIFQAEIETRRIYYRGETIQVASFRDITERKRLEDRANEQQQQLIQSDKMASLGVLTAGVAHEISNPNHIILLTIQVLTDICDSIDPIMEEYYMDHGDFLVAGVPYSQSKKKFRNYLQDILTAARKIDNIASSLKEFSSHEPASTLSAVDMNLVVKAAVTLTANLLEKSTKNCKISLAPSLPTIQGNPQRLEQVLINLIQNACLSLSGKDQSVYISTSYNEDDGQITVSVRDEGTGIPEETLTKIQEPFFTTRRKNGGTGLGLYISHSILNEYGGRMVFKSKEGQGTQVNIILLANDEEQRGGKNE